MSTQRVRTWNTSVHRNPQLDEVKRALEGSPRTIPSKYFYDDRGSRLFEEITRQPEYYPTRTEAALLRERAAPWIAALGARSLVELGAGNGEKTRILLDALGPGSVYTPVDISAEFLERSAAELEQSYPHLHIHPVVSDITRSIAVPLALPRPAVFAFLGSTIGNFDNASATALLKNIATSMRPTDRLLLGADLRKDAEVLNRAYNDVCGVTAEFNLNILRSVNDAVGTDFDPRAFEHLAFYNRDAHRIEMHLVALRDQVVHLPDSDVVRIAAGEPIRTEISQKYDEASIHELMAAAGLALREWWVDANGWYALATATLA